jgi:hypothetical protein
MREIANRNDLQIPVCMVFPQEVGTAAPSIISQWVTS